MTKTKQEQKHMAYLVKTALRVAKPLAIAIALALSEWAVITVRDLFAEEKPVRKKKKKAVVSKRNSGRTK